MAEPEEQIHSFVLKFWLEEGREEAERTLWRGHITHVASGVRQYVTTLDSIAAFVAPYLKGSKPSGDKRWRLRQWLCTRLRF